jgi:hypothetical protein
LKTVSVTTSPPTSQPIAVAMTVTVGSSEFLRTYLRLTAHGVSPLKAPAHLDRLDETFVVMISCV